MASRRPARWRSAAGGGRRGGWRWGRPAARPCGRRGGAVALPWFGILLGTMGSLAAGRVLSGLLYGVTATAPLVFGGVVLLLGVVALVAAGIPALRASRIDPVTSMRE